MMTFGEPEEPLEKKAEDGSPPQPFYDPLIAPWEDAVSSAQFRETELEAEEETAFSFDYAPPPPVAWPQEELAESPRPYEEVAASARPYGEVGSIARPYGETEDLSDIRRRLREETVALPQPQPRRKWSVTAREVVETLLLALLIFLAVRTSLQNFRVEGQSMMPSLDNGEYLIVNKLAYAEIDLSVFNWLPFFEVKKGSTHHLWSAPSRGDVIVFRSPTDVERDFIKRIVGLPGDTIQIVPESSTVVVNGKALEEPYVQRPTSCQQKCEWTVPPESYFVLGDNRPNSSDSRQGWFVPEENIIGKTLITYWDNGQLDLKLAPNHSSSFASEAAAKE